MKTKPITLNLIVALCGICATTAVFAQTTQIWDGGPYGTNTDLATAVNWVNDTLPALGDTCLWDGTAPGNIVITYASGFGGYAGSSGLFFEIASTQTGSWTFLPAPTLQGASGFLALDSIYIREGAGPVTIGGNESARWLIIIRRPSGGTRYLQNDSTNPAVITPYVEWRAGGAATYDHYFTGSGDWIVNNSLIDNNKPDHNGNIVVTGPGRVFWNPIIAVPISEFLGTINVFYGGTLVLQGYHPRLEIGGNYSSQQAITIDGTFIFDAPGVSQIISGLRPISGSGTLVVTNGTLTVLGQNTFSGSIQLNGGVLVAGSAENEGVSGPLGLGSTIYFNGGVLRYSANNQYDYSGRFATDAGQKYKIDTAAQTVVYTNSVGLPSSGGSLTKLGAGTLILTAASAYTGETVVSGGSLIFRGPKTGTGNITVADGAALGVADTGTQIVTATLTLGTSAGCSLEFENISSTTRAPLGASTLYSGGTVTVNIYSGTFVTGQRYPLLTWVSGSAPSVTLGVLIGAGGFLSIEGNTLYLNITGPAYVWSGANNGNWDTNTPNNWSVSGTPAVFADGGAALFDDTATGETNITINSIVKPASITVNNSTKSYSVTARADAYIDGDTGLYKSGSGLLSLSGGYNRYTGVTKITGGTLRVSTLSDGNLPSDIGAAASSAESLVLNGGTLAYTGPSTSIDRLFTVGTSGGALDASGSGALVFRNIGSVGLSGSGARVLTLTGSNSDENTIAAAIGDMGGATALLKSGAGRWVLTGDNTYSGGTTISAGTLQVGNGGATGSLGTGNVVNNGTLIFNRSGTITNDGAISGTGSVIKDGPGTLILPANNSYQGGTIISNGVLQVGNGGATGKLYGTGPIDNYGTFIYDSTGELVLSGGGIISGTGNVIVRRGMLKAVGANTFTGWLLIEEGAIFQPTIDNAGARTALTSPVVTNNGILRFECYDTRDPYYGNIVGTGPVQMGANNVTYDSGRVVLAGTNTYTGGTYIGGNHLQFGDGTTPGAGTFVGDVVFCNNWSGAYDNVRRLVFNYPDDRVIANNIITNFVSPQNNLGIVVQDGTGTLTLLGNNTYAGGTDINAGALQVGNGGTAGTIGYGRVSINNGSMLIWNRGDDVTFDAPITSTTYGTLVKAGAGTLTLTTTNLSYHGETVVSNGTLIVTGQIKPGVIMLGGYDEVNYYASNLRLEGGTLIAGGRGTVVTTVVPGGEMRINSGTIVVTVNKSVSPSNSLFLVTNILGQTAGTITAQGGTIQVVNAGPQLVVGDKFILFSGPVENGALLSVTGGNANWVNNLAVDGSISVASVIGPPTTPTNISYSVSAGNVTLSWPASHIGWILQVQTNALSVGISTNWVDVPGSASTNQVVFPIDTTKGTVFFRLRYP